MPANVRKRPDTRFLAETTLTTDLSQRKTNLTAAAPGGYEANSVRTGITGENAGRSIEVACDVDSSSAGVLVDHDNGALYRISIASAGTTTVAFSIGAMGDIATLTIATSGTARPYVIAWSTEPNPLTTGAMDALRSEVLAYDVDNSTLYWTAVTHGVASSNPNGTFTVGGVYTGGAMTLGYSDTIDIIRISCRFHTRVETREHFVAQTAPPAVTSLQACEAPRIPPQMIAPGVPAGPAYQMAAASMKPGRNRHRLLSPLWNFIAAIPTSFADDIRDAMNPKLVLNLGDGWQVPMWIARRQVPRTATRLQVMMQAVNYRLNNLLATDKVAIRFHCSDRMPGKPGIKESHILWERTVNDGSAMALGVLHTFDDWCKVERGSDGYSWFWLSMRTDDGSGAGNAGYQIRGASVIPVVLESSEAEAAMNPWGP